MTPEERFTRIEENLLVITKMQERSERRIDGLTTALEAVGGHLDTLTERQRELAERQHELADRQAELNAALQALTQQIDRFISGQGGNGHAR